MLRATWHKSPDFKYQQVALNLQDLKAAERLHRVQDVFNVCGMKCVPVAMRDALNACRQDGVDLNSIVFQTGPDEWWQLLPYVMGRATEKSMQAMQVLLDEPDLTLDQQCAWKDPQAHRQRREPLIMGLPHLLVRIAADHLKEDSARLAPMVAAYEALLDRLVARGANLSMADSAGNTVLHTVVQCMDPVWVDHWSDRFIALGVDPDARNLVGKTMLDVGQARLATLPVNASKPRQRFMESLTRMEQRELTNLANRVTDDGVDTRPRSRL